jgi:hypothetical protein
MAQRCGDGDPLAELRAYVLENPSDPVMSLVERFGLSQRRVVACLADLESSGQIVRDCVVRTDGWLYPAHGKGERGQLVVRRGLARTRAYLSARTAALEIAELSLALPPESAARVEKRVVPDKVAGVVTGRIVVSACWLLGVLDASAGRVAARRRRRVLELAVEARADKRRVELCLVDGKLVDARVAVDAAWLAELVGRSRRARDGEVDAVAVDAAEVVARLSESAKASLAARDLSSVAAGVPARVEVDAAWLAGVVASRSSRSSRTGRDVM